MVRKHGAWFRYMAVGFCIAAALVVCALVDNATEQTIHWNGPAMAASDRQREYVVKATYLRHLGHYVRWPTSAGDPSQETFVVGIVGESPVVDAMRELPNSQNGKRRSLTVKQFRSMADYTRCHVLFLPASLDKDKKQQAIQRLQDAPVLLVGEEPGFADRDGMMNLTFDGKRVAVEVNLQAARRAGLEISSRLLGVSKIVADQ